MKFLLHKIALAIFFMVITSCVSLPPQIQQSWANKWYLVKSGDTLYSIAWRYGLDYKQLASWNRINIKSIIKPGQRLKLFQPGSIATASIKSSVPSKATESPARTETGQSPVTSAETSRWLWPANGIILNSFSASKPDRRGIDIAGKLGQPVHATADGKVVYSGNGLSGYGNLIIIKHSDTFLSAYAYCQKRFVKEGMWVRAGMVIANMGQHKTTMARLHFEIRKNGAPVDPLKYLPKR